MRVSDTRVWRRLQGHAHNTAPFLTSLKYTVQVTAARVRGGAFSRAAAVVKSRRWRALPRHGHAPSPVVNRFLVATTSASKYVTGSSTGSGAVCIWVFTFGYARLDSRRGTRPFELR
jgi:hypothetical protein